MSSSAEDNGIGPHGLLSGSGVLSTWELGTVWVQCPSQADVAVSGLGSAHTEVCGGGYASGSRPWRLRTVEEMAAWYTQQILRGETEVEQ